MSSSFFTPSPLAAPPPASPPAASASVVFKQNENENENENEDDENENLQHSAKPYLKAEQPADPVVFQNMLLYCLLFEGAGRLRVPWTSSSDSRVRWRRNIASKFSQLADPEGSAAKQLFSQLQDLEERVAAACRLQDSDYKRLKNCSITHSNSLQVLWSPNVADSFGQPCKAVQFFCHHCRYYALECPTIEHRYLQLAADIEEEARQNVI
jgi:hypothetical protein